MATHDNALYTFSYLLVLYFAIFSIFSVRERRWFWATMPSEILLSTLAAEALAGTVLVFAGLPGLAPLPGWQTLAVFVYAVIMCLGVNDALKVVMIRWRVLDAAAGKPVDLTPQIAQRAHELYEERGRQDGGALRDRERAEREIRKDERRK